MSVELVRYDAACQALAAARSVDEVMAIRDEAAQLAAAARIANNHQAEADAVAIRMRATRRLGQLMQAQKESVGFNRGAAAGGKKSGPRGSLTNPRDLRPTLASQGINKQLAHHARVLSGPSEQDFKALVADAHDRVARAVRNTVREIESEQERESPRAAQRKATEAETKARKGNSRDDIGPNSSQEAERLRARCEELENQNALLRRENLALRKEVEELKQRLANATGKAAPAADDGLDIPERRTGAAR
jgi:hypothetical protein